MRNMIIARIFETALRLEGEKRAGLGIRRRALQAFPPAAGAPATPPLAGIFYIAFPVYLMYTGLYEQMGG
jgi:hypothetical protein